MKCRGLVLVLAGIASVYPAFAQSPTISAVLDAAGFTKQLAPGSLAVVYGTGTGITTSTTVMVGGQPAKVLTATENQNQNTYQITIQIPSGAQLGQTGVLVANSAVFNIQILPYAPALFTADGSGTGTVLALHTATQAPVTSASPASAGETVTLFGNGMGPTNADGATTKPVTATVGGQSATVISAALSTTQTGYYLINLTVPAAAGGAQPVVVTISGNSSATAVTAPTLPVTNAPSISPGGVRNAATNVPLGGATAGIAQGSFIAIYGNNLGPSAAVQASGLPLQTSLGGSTVTITPAGGSPILAYPTYAGTTQINAILPSNVPVGPATVTVTYNNQTSSAAKINVVVNSFGIFTAYFGLGPAATINLNAPVYYNLFTNPASAGNLLELYGTGLGPVTVGDNVAPGAVSPPNIQVQVMVGAQTVTPLYAGRSPQYPGLDQINILLPAGLPDSCYLPIAVAVNGVVSNYATLSISASGSTCPAPFGLTAANLQTFDRGGTLAGGLISLSRITSELSAAGLTLDSSTEQAGAVFAPFNAAAYYSLAQTPGAAAPFNPAGTCVMLTTGNTAVPTSTVPSSPLQWNAGSPLTLSGPNSATASLPFSAASGYNVALAASGLNATSSLPTTFIAAGPWTMKGIGGPDVGSFTANLTAPTPLACTSCASVSTVDRTKPLTVTWTGGGGSQDWVQIGGLSTEPSLADPTKNLAVAFSCTAHATDGTFTIPASVLGQLPPSSSNPAAANIGALVLVNVLGTSSPFSAPLTAGGNLDLGLFTYSTLFFKVVGYN